jgi:hypothetical protein
MIESPTRLANPATGTVAIGQTAPAVPVMAVPVKGDLAIPPVPVTLLAPIESRPASIV